MKIISYNLNGIRAAMNKGLVDWLKDQDADVVCFQELKANADQFEVAEFEALGYHCHWHSAEKKGYSGVALLSKKKPSNVLIGSGIKAYDSEGRVIRADFGKITIVSAYFPSGSSGDLRQEVKMKFLKAIYTWQRKLRKERPHSILLGDYNIANHPIDIHNPKGNKNSSGFLPEEREWLDKFWKDGWVDTFRHFHPETPDRYSWWSYRSGARKNNKGWRIDYAAVTEELKSKLKSADILDQAIHSDHCPIVLELA